MSRVARAATGLLLALSVPLAIGFGWSGTAAGDSRLDRWSRAERALIASMHIDRLGPAPADPSNAVHALEAAAAFGERLFADVRLSSNGQVACASCHLPSRQFQDDRPVGRGVGVGVRRTMPVAGAAHAPWFFWDGRKDSLWSQALGPLEDAAEHGANRTRLARVLQTAHRDEYESVFGPMPDLSRLPADASPVGSVAERAAWRAMSAAERDTVNRVFANLGKAMAAYERTVVPGASRFDHYAAAVASGESTGLDALSAAEKRGLRVFIGDGRCATCHNGPLMTDHHFHNTGVPQRDPARPDRGRVDALARVRRDEFNCLGPYSDAPADACAELRFIVADDPSLAGAFKTPGLRNVALRPPYMHAGQLATLDEVVAHYARSPRAAVGHSELAHDGGGHAERERIRLDVADSRDLAAFLAALSGPVVSRSSPRTP